MNQLIFNLRGFCCFLGVNIWFGEAYMQVRVQTFFFSSIRSNFFTPEIRGNFRTRNRFLAAGFFLASWTFDDPFTAKLLKVICLLVLNEGLKRFTIFSSPFALFSLYIAITAAERIFTQGQAAITQLFKLIFNSSESTFFSKLFSGGIILSGLIISYICWTKYLIPTRTSQIYFHTLERSANGFQSPGVQHFSVHTAILNNYIFTTIIVSVLFKYRATYSAFLQTSQIGKFTFLTLLPRLWAMFSRKETLKYGSSLTQDGGINNWLNQLTTQGIRLRGYPRNPEVTKEIIFQRIKVIATKPVIFAVLGRRIRTFISSTFILGGRQIIQVFFLINVTLNILQKFLR
jgi:hypothetical protein